MIIAVDGMGGDNAPKEIIEGVYKALEEFGDISVQLYGNQEKMQPFLKQHERLNVIHCEEIIEATDDPVRAVRRKKRGIDGPDGSSGERRPCGCLRFCRQYRCTDGSWAICGWAH
nr:hypothetical protein [Planococcus glaciei]